MTISEKPELLAAYFTISGNVYPFGPSEISPFAFEDRVKAAANAGYTGFGLGYADLMAVGDDLGYPEMRRVLQDNGIEHVEFELLADWYSSGEKRRQSDKQRFEFLEAAEALGARGIKVWADIGEPIDDYSTIVEEYALLCRQAHEHGTKFMFEVTPFDTVRSIEGARKIMEDCGEKNCGLLLDIWHISRGHMNIEEIRKIPGHFIHSIELADADIYPLKDLIEDTCHRRRLCGEGSFELARFIDAVESTGYAGPWGVEILSADFRQKPLDQLATASYQTALKMFSL